MNALRDVAAALGQPMASTATITGWCIDSRTVQPGDLFFALRGPHHDGHDYVSALRPAGGAVGRDRRGSRSARVPVR